MAAGLGFKTFTTGEVLTAADTNGYLMQGILVFASAAARDSAITSPQEGQACYLKDTNEVLTYSGSAWVAVGGAGGGMTLINSGGTTLTGTSVVIGSIPQTYYNLQLIVRDFRPSSDGDQLKLKFNSDGTANSQYYDVWSSGTGSAAWNRSSIILINDIDNGASDGLVIADFYDYANTSTYKTLVGHAFGANATTPANIQYYNVKAYYKSTNAISSIELITDSGSAFTSGTAFLYGVK